MASSPTLDFQQAKTNHLLFKSRLRAILYGMGDATDNRVLSQYACAIGKWLYSHALIQYEAIPEVTTLEEVHSQLHRVARHLIDQYQQGNVDEARLGLISMERLADKLVELLEVVEDKVTTHHPGPVSPANPNDPSDVTDALRALLAQNELLDNRIKQQTGHTDPRHPDRTNGLYDFFMQAPAAFAILRGPEHVFELVNPYCQHLIGGRNPLRQTIRQALPELAGQGFCELLDTVYTTRQPFAGRELSITILDHTGQLRLNYIDVIFQPTADHRGKSDGILALATDVTEQVLARRKIEENELYVRNIVDNTDAAIIVYEGPDMVCTLVNGRMMALLGRHADTLMGKPMPEAVPELANDSLTSQLKHLMATGESFFQPEESFTLSKDGSSYTGYYACMYKALKDTEHVPYGILCTAIDITDQVLSRKKIEQAEASLRVALELAELGTWQFNLTTNTLHFSDRLRQWFGIGADEIITSERASDSILEADRSMVEQAIRQAIAPGSNGTYAVEYRLDAEKTGRARILQGQGKAFFDKQGLAYAIRGMAQDITEQRNSQLRLEQLVQERTEELRDANKKIADANRELEEANQNLIRSNHNLEQFAYVASHDLQEPLRKIQQFGDLLKTQYVIPSGNELIYLERMQSAAGRMSFLIRDLLAFSRISTRQVTTTQVPLNQVIDEVLDNLSIIIGETNAQIQVAPLPILQGDRSQLGQLFLNLIANAIKFHRSDESGNPIPPNVTVQARLVAASGLPNGTKPTLPADSYHEIDIIDQGIGFDERYLDRIFQVFQRLHGRQNFAGTGIGLAICQKVVTNHGGAITASSKPGEGTVFHVYLPA